MESADFPWRPLGTLLVEEGLLTDQELETALAEQKRTGRLLGQIVVDHGYLSAFSLARMLAEQHGVELRPARVEADRRQPPPGPPEPKAPPTWRPLGTVLIEKDFLTQAELDEALATQRAEGGRLGEILVAQGALTGTQLGRALAEQHGVEIDENALDEELETLLKPHVEGEPVYQVCEVIFAPIYQTRTVLFENANFLEAADFAFEFVETREPAALEIQRAEGETRETVWTYSASRAAAAAASRKDLVDTFGFDPTKWDAASRFGHDPLAK
jgi:hypothetical protein